MLIYQLQQEKYSPTLFISLLYSYRDFFPLITVAWHKGKRAMPVVRKSGFKYWFCSFLTVGPWGSQLTSASSKCELCELKSTIHTLGIMAIIRKCTVKKRKTMNWLSTSLVTTKTLFLTLKYTHSVVKLNNKNTWVLYWIPGPPDLSVLVLAGYDYLPVHFSHLELKPETSPTHTHVPWTI